MATSDLNPRSGRVLTTVVREYIHTGEPVASVVVARRGSLGVSSATIRSVLARLEEQGFVRQPHTSAGRVPTDRGYRFYVDLLLESRRPGDRSAVADQIRQVASEESSFDRLLAQVSHVLSQDSHHVGFALAPATDDQRLQKIVETIDVLSPEELRRAAECVNREFSGLAIEDVRARILARLQTARGLYDRLHEHALQMADRALDARSREQTLYVDGTSSLLAEAEASQQHAELSLRTLRALVEMIEEKQRLVRLLSQYLEGPGLAVVIGAEHRLPDLKPFSLIAASYLDGRRSGSVGIIGPTRMRYSRAIGAVESAARAVGEALGRN